MCCFAKCAADAECVGFAKCAAEAECVGFAQCLKGTNSAEGCTLRTK
ncbi:MAG: hypothetical protein IK004_02880 [Bacteroidales bacterium]|nr:hypothetical protein [Bacteroidales bacterium]